MTLEQQIQAMKTDFDTYAEVVVFNNPTAIYQKFLKYDMPNITHEVDALNYLTQFYVNGETDKVIDILNVPFILGQSSEVEEEAMLHLQSENKLKSGGFLNAALSVVAGAINGFTGNNTQQPQIVYVPQKEDNTQKYIIYGALVVLLIIIIVLVIKMTKK